MYTSPIVQFLWVCIFSSSALALWKGDTPARIAGGINFLSAIVLPLVRLALKTDTGDIVALVGDGAWAVGLLLLAVRYGSLWLGATMLLQAVQFSLHGYYLVTEAHRDLTYIWVNNLDTLGVTACIALGAVLAIQRRVRQRREDAHRAEIAGEAKAL